MNRRSQLIIIGLLIFLLLLVGVTYAYFSIQSSSDGTSTNIKGSATKLGSPTLKTETANLYLNLNASLMSKENSGVTYYANKDESGLALTTNPNYTLATASVPDLNQVFDCTYTYKVTASITKEITDNSDNDVMVTIDYKTMTLKEILASGTNGIIVKGKLKGLTSDITQSISLSSYVKNTSNTQDNLVDNSYTITITPYTSGDTKAFSCKLAYQFDSNKTLADNLIDSGNLWQSNLEGDGYRYVGSGVVGEPTNPDKYMYRILRIFPDSNGEEHIKLIKYLQLGSSVWNSDYQTDVNWKDSDIYKRLNGDYFLTNPKFSYFQNSFWLNKIEDWTWSAANTQSEIDTVNSVEYSYSTPTGIYLNEMHTSTNELLCSNSNDSLISCSTGSWTTPLAKVGLMYVSDYAFSLGNIALSLKTAFFRNTFLLRTGWINYDNNEINKTIYEWTMSRLGGTATNYYYAYFIISEGALGKALTSGSFSMRPVFYLDENVKLSSTSGNGTIESPFILE